jgi:hypothetical protein
MLVSKEYKKQIINWYVSQIKKLNISDKTFGFFMRAFHVNLPIYCVIVMVYGSQFMNICTLIFLLCVSISFITFDGCILSMIENDIDKENIAIVDPFLEMFGYKTTNQNRMKLATGIAVFYMIFAFFIYFKRFLEVPDLSLDNQIINTPNIEINN